MTTRYLSTTGVDSGSALTRATAWGTLAYALAHMSPADHLWIAPGTYEGGTTPPSGTGDTTRTVLRADKAYTGQVIIDGSDHIACLPLWGSEYVTVENLSFCNNGANLIGWSNVEGVSIRDLNNTPGIGRNAHHIKVSRCRFFNFVRSSTGDYRGALPLVVGCYSDERLDHEACTNIEILDNVFEETLSDIRAGDVTVLATSQCVFSGNIKDWIIKGNTFHHNMNRYREGNGGIEFASNYNQSPGYYETYPDQVRKGIIADNHFYYDGVTASSIGGVLTGRYAIYVQASADVLVERNLLHRWPLGIGVVAEKGLAPNTSQRVWVRNNVVVEPEQYGLLVGAWADNYRSPEDVYFANNTVVRDALAPSAFPLVSVVCRNTTDSPEGVDGDWGFFNNLVIAPDKVMSCELALAAGIFEGNQWVSQVANAFRYPTYPTVTGFPYATGNDTEGGLTTVDPITVGFSNAWLFKPHGVDRKRRLPYGLVPPSKSWPVGAASPHVPSWYTAGMFGAYDTETTEVDMLGVERSGFDVGALECPGVNRG